MGPNLINQGKMGPNNAKPDQTGPKLGHTGSNGPSGAKFGHMGPKLSNMAIFDYTL